MPTRTHSVDCLGEDRMPWTLARSRTSPPLLTWALGGIDDGICAASEMFWLEDASHGVGSTGWLSFDGKEMLVTLLLLVAAAGAVLLFWTCCACCRCFSGSPFERGTRSSFWKFSSSSTSRQQLRTEQSSLPSPPWGAASQSWLDEATKDQGPFLAGVGAARGADLAPGGITNLLLVLLVEVQVIHVYGAGGAVLAMVRRRNRRQC